MTATSLPPVMRLAPAVPTVLDGVGRARAQAASWLASFVVAFALVAHAADRADRAGRVPDADRQG